MRRPRLFPLEIVDATPVGSIARYIFETLLSFSSLGCKIGAR